MKHTVLILPTRPSVEQIKKASNSYLVWYCGSCWGEGSVDMCAECSLEWGSFCSSVISHVTSKLDVKAPTFLTPDEFLFTFPELFI